MNYKKATRDGDIDHGKSYHNSEGCTSLRNNLVSLVREVGNANR